MWKACLAAVFLAPACGRQLPKALGPTPTTALTMLEAGLLGAASLVCLRTSDTTPTPDAQIQGRGVTSTLVDRRMDNRKETSIAQRLGFRLLELYGARVTSFPRPLPMICSSCPPIPPHLTPPVAHSKTSYTIMTFTTQSLHQLRPSVSPITNYIAYPAPRNDHTIQRSQLPGLNLEDSLVCISQLYCSVASYLPARWQPQHLLTSTMIPNSPKLTPRTSR